MTKALAWLWGTLMLARGEACADEGRQRYEARQRSIAAIKTQVATLGFEVNPVGASA